MRRQSAQKACKPRQSEDRHSKDESYSTSPKQIEGVRSIHPGYVSKMTSIYSELGEDKETVRLIEPGECLCKHMTTCLSAKLTPIIQKMDKASSSPSGKCNLKLVSSDKNSELSSANDSSRERSIDTCNEEKLIKHNDENEENLLPVSEPSGKDDTVILIEEDDDNQCLILNDEDLNQIKEANIPGGDCTAKLTVSSENNVDGDFDLIEFEEGDSQYSEEQQCIIETEHLLEKIRQSSLYGSAEGIANSWKENESTSTMCEKDDTASNVLCRSDKYESLVLGISEVATASRPEENHSR